MMLRYRSYVLVGLLLFGACSSPNDQKPGPGDAGSDGTESADVGMDDRDPDQSVSTDMTGVDVDFDFGFQAVPFEGEITGIQPATVMWNGTERTAQLFLFGRLGTLSFEADGQLLTYRLEADIGFLSGEIALRLTERSCTSEAGTCDAIPDALLAAPVYETVGRHDGSQVIFAPLTVRADALAAAPDFDFRPPLDPRMTPNDGFKPAQVPDARGNWVGDLTFIPGGGALTGEDSCNIVIDQIGADYEIVSMACGATYALDADPGPETASLEVDRLNWLVSFDFVDGATRYTFAGIIDVGTWAGVIVEASRYDELDSPFDAEIGDVEGLFTFDDVP